MTTTDLHHLETQLRALCARVSLLTSGCRSSDHGKIAEPEEQIKLLFYDLLRLHSWVEAHGIVEKTLTKPAGPS